MCERALQDDFPVAEIQNQLQRHHRHWWHPHATSWPKVIHLFYFLFQEQIMTADQLQQHCVKFNPKKVNISHSRLMLLSALLQLQDSRGHDRTVPSPRGLERPSWSWGHEEGEPQQNQWQGAEHLCREGEPTMSLSTLQLCISLAWKYCATEDELSWNSFEWMNT